MPKKLANDYLLLFRGGADPEDMSPDQLKATRHNWTTWMKELKKRKLMTAGCPLRDGGKVFSGARGKNVAPLRETQDAIGGYVLIRAKNLSEATRIAKACPIYNNGGTAELRAIEQMKGI